MKESTPSELLIQIAKILDELGINYYVTGGFATSVWGKPRFTADIDLIIKLARYQKEQFAQAIQKISPKGYLDKDQIDTALVRHGEFNFIDPDTGIKVDFWIAKSDAFEKECFAKKETQDIGYKVNFISPENLILSKLLWYKQTGSNRHLEDAQSVLEISPVDKNYLKKWALKLELGGELEKLKF